MSKVTYPDITGIEEGLPDQAGNSGKYLTTDGTTASWDTVAAGASTFAALTDVANSDVTGAVDLKSDTSFEVGYDDGAGALVLIQTAVDGFNNNHELPDGSYVEMRGDASAAEKILDFNVQDAGGTNLSRLSVIVDATGVARIQSTGVSDYPCTTYNGAGTTELVYAKTVHLFTGTAPSGNVIINKAKSGDVLYIKNDTASSITFIQNSTETFNGATTFVLTTGKVATFIQAGANGIYGVVSNKDLTGDVTTSGSVATLGSNFKTESKGITIDGGGSAITTGSKGFLTIPYNATVTGWTILADQSGSVVIDVKKSTYSGFPTTASIAGSEKPTLSSAQKNQDLALSTWTTTVTAGDVWEFIVDSASTVTRVYLSCTLVKT